MILALPLIMIIISTIFAAFGATMLKLGTKKSYFNKTVVYGIILYVSSAVFYFLALRITDLSVLYPLGSLSYVWVLVISKYYLKESFNRLKLVGSTFIMFGVILVGIS